MHIPILHACYKCIESDHHFFRDHVVNGGLQIRHVSSQDQLVDLLTKPLSTLSFQILRLLINLTGATSVSS